MTYFADYTSPIDPTTLRLAGISGVCRYLSWPRWWGGRNHDYDNPKIIQKAEYDRLVNAGIQVILNWEYDSQDWLGGQQGAGSVHAVQAVSMAKALGYPAGSVIVGSADFDMSWAQWTASGSHYWEGYRNGIIAGGYRPGVYGPYDVLRWVSDAGGSELYWQAGMSYAWSGGRNRQVYPEAHLFQAYHQMVGGQDVDINRILRDVETMALSVDDINKIVEGVWGKLVTIPSDPNGPKDADNPANETHTTGIWLAYSTREAWLAALTGGAMTDAQYADFKAAYLATVPTAEQLVAALVAKLPAKTV